MDQFNRIEDGARLPRPRPVSPPRTILVDYNAFTSDLALQAALEGFGGGWAAEAVTGCGALVGSAEVQELVRDADRHPPRQESFDQYGQRVERLELHPSWHALMQRLRGSGYHSLAWSTARPGAHAARAAIAYLWNQAEGGVSAAGAVSFASLAALRADAGILAQYQEKILSRGYDARPLPASAKTAISVGMATAERRGGSDLQRTEVLAEPAGRRTGPGATYRLTGHKAFFALPDSDLFLTLARSAGGVSCFLAPGWLEDGERNRLFIRRLRNKWGNRSKATGEVDFDGLRAVMLGEEGQGVATIREMSLLLWLECAIASAASVRQASVQAIALTESAQGFHHGRAEQPMLANVLADLAIEAEAQLWLVLRAAAALDHPSEQALARLLIPIAKYWTCKRAPAAVAEALECQGGEGALEDHPVARLYRRAPLAGLWEGDGNAMCLEVIRALETDSDAAAMLLDEIAISRRVHPALDASLGRLTAQLAAPQLLQTEARRFMEALALALTASLLLRSAPEAVSRVFCDSRLGRDYGTALGTLPGDTACEAIIGRAAVG